MSYSIQRAVSDGTLSSLALSIQYYARTDISVYLSNVLWPVGTAWAWSGATGSTIKFKGPVPNGIEVMVKRITDVSDIRHNFSQGAQFTSATLDDNFKQMLFVAQEAQEGGRTITDVFGDIDMHGFKVRNMGAATELSGAAQLAQAGGGSTGNSPGIAYQPFTGDGVKTAFPLGSSSLSMLVFVSGVYQQSTGWGLVGSNLVFSEAPPAGVSIEVLTLGTVGSSARATMFDPSAAIPDTNVQSAIERVQSGVDKVAAAIAGRAGKYVYTSEYKSLQAAVDAIEAMGGGTVFVDSDKYPCPNQLFMDYSITTIQGLHGAASSIDASNMPTSGAYQYWVNWRNMRRTSYRKEPFVNIEILGPPGSRKINFAYMGSPVGDGFTHVHFRGMSVVDFDAHLVFGTQCSNISFDSCHFSNSGANFRTSTCIKTVATGSVDNTGENISFYGGTQFNNVDCIVENNLGMAGGFSFSQCTFAYFRRGFYLNAPCKVTLGAGCHTETDSYSHHWVSVAQNGALFRASGSEFWFAGTMNYHPFASYTTAVFGGIYLDNCDYHTDTVGIETFVKPGTDFRGMVKATNWLCQDGLARIPMGYNPGSQLEPWPTSHVNFGAAFKPDGNNASKTQVRTDEDWGGASTEFYTDTAGQQISVRRRWPAVGGQVLVGSIRVKTKGFTADGTGMGIYVSALDADGKAISSGNPFVLAPGTDKAVFTKVDLNWYPTLPPGTAFYELQVYANPSAGTRLREVFLADVIINAH